MSSGRLYSIRKLDYGSVGSVIVLSHCPHCTNKMRLESNGWYRPGMIWCMFHRGIPEDDLKLSPGEEN